MSKESQEPGAKAPLIRYALSVINTISILIGVAVGLMHIKEISRHAEEIAKFLKISSIGYLEEFTDKYDATQENLTRILAEIETKEEEVRRRIGTGETGQTIYYSDPMEDYQAICGFWERSSAFVELDYFDFQTVYALKAFPRGFWNKTAKIRKMLGDNWYGRDQPLIGFLSGMEELEKRYRQEDAKELKKGGGN